MSGSVGSVVATQVLTGNTASGRVGSVTPNVSIALSGVAASGLTGTLVAVYWKLIDDSQTANWAAIDNSETAGWTTINNSQTVAWTAINNAQTASWTTIDDSEATSWSLIDAES